MSSPLTYSRSGRYLWDRLGPRAAILPGAPVYVRVVGGALSTLVALTLVLFAWALITVYYMLWLPLLPVLAVWRLLRRSSRRERAADRRHRETIDAIRRER